MQTTHSVVEHEQHDSDSQDIFGFWIYIMSDCILFATLFATYAVLHNNTFGGPGIKDLVSMSYVLAETLFLLTSNFTFGIAIIYLYKNQKTAVLNWLVITFILGLAFVGLELYEFIHLVAEGHSWQNSGFLSAFFTLVGTHGLHVSFGLLWIFVMWLQLKKFDINSVTRKRMTYLGLFWNFLDIVWIFVFTIVYLMGAV